MVGGLESYNEDSQSRAIYTTIFKLYLILDHTSIAKWIKSPY